MRRRDFLRKTAGSLAFLTLPVTGCEFKPRRPNIIYILADDLGYGDLGCYGQKQIQTPHIDTMAYQGMRFTDHYAGSTVCAPSRGSLMTGYHTGHGYVRGNANQGAGLPLRQQDITVAELLQEAGYVTGIFGKWGLGTEGTSGHPNRQGFDEFFGYLNQVHAHNYYPEYLWENQRKYSLDNEVRYMQSGYAEDVGGEAVKKRQYSPDIIQEKVLEFIDHNHSNSFFLYVPVTIPHANNEAPHISGSHGMEIPDYGIYAERDWPEPQKGLAAMITRLDGYVKEILDRLAQYNLSEKTLVLFSSDNGPHKEGKNNPGFFDSNGPFRGIKRDLYEGGIRVPLIACWPGTIQPDLVTSHVSAFWDFLPTACDLADITPPGEIDGISFSPTLLGKRQTEHEYLYWEFAPFGGRQAVRQNQWKAVRRNVTKNPDRPVELYDLSVDPEENHDLAESLPEVAGRMKTLLHRSRTPSDRFPLFSEE